MLVGGKSPHARAEEQRVGRSIIRQRVDDLDGSSAARTIAFAIDGERFEIDLGEQNEKALRAIFATYIEAGRSVGQASRKPGKPGRRDGKRVGAIQVHPGGEVASRISIGSRPASPSAEQIDSHSSLGGEGPTVDHPSIEPADAPLAEVVPLQRQRRTSSGGIDVAGQRSRLTADVTELFRLAVVAVLAMTADRLMTPVAKPGTSRAEINRRSAGRRRDLLKDTASAKSGAPLPSSVAPAG
jgi:Lsr2